MEGMPTLLLVGRTAVLKRLLLKFSVIFLFLPNT